MFFFHNLKVNNLNVKKPEEIEQSISLGLGDRALFNAEIFKNGLL